LELYQYFRRVVGSSCSAQSLAGAGAGGPGGPTAEPGLSKEDAAPIGANGAGAGLSNSTGFVHCDALVFELYQYFRRVEGSSCSAQSLAGLGAATPNGTIGAGVTGLSNSTGLVHCEAFVFELYQYFFLVVGSSCSVQSLAGASGLGAMEPTGANGAGAGLSNSMGFVHCDTFVFELYQYFFFVTGSSCSCQSLAGAAGALGPGGAAGTAGLFNSSGFVHWDLFNFALYQYFFRVVGSVFSVQSLAGAGAGAGAGAAGPSGRTNEDEALDAPGASGPGGSPGNGAAGLLSSSGFVHCDLFSLALYQYFFSVVGSVFSVQSLAGKGAAGKGAGGLFNSSGFVHCDLFNLALYQYFFLVVGSSCSFQSLGAGAGANGIGAAGFFSSSGSVHCDLFNLALYQYFFSVAGSDCSAQSLAGVVIIGAGRTKPDEDDAGPGGTAGLLSSAGLSHCDALVFELYQYFFLVVGSSCSAQSLAGGGAPGPGGSAGLFNSAGLSH